MKKEKFIFLFLFLMFFIVVTTVACRKHKKQISIARIDNEIITFHNFKCWLNSKNVDFPLGYDSNQKMLNLMLEELVLLKETGQYVTVAKNVANLPNASLLMNEFKSEIIKNFTLEISDRVIKDYYSTHPNLFTRKKQYRLYHILLESEEKLQSLVQLFKSLLSTTKDLYESVFLLTPSISGKDPLKRSWGDLGWVSEGKFPKEFDQRVFSLKESEYTTFSTPLGYHFVMVMNIRDPRAYSLGEVSHYIKGKLENEKRNKLWSDFIHSLKLKHNVKLYSRNLRKVLSEEERKGMVFIPGGKFYVGYSRKEVKERYKIWKEDVKPYVDQEEPGWLSYIYQTYRETKVNQFYIDKYEVTYGEYKEFLKATGHRPLPEWIEKSIPGDNYPVGGVSWYDADAYCKRKGKRLPTQDEWEFASRGEKRRRYPWGNEHLDGKRGNYADINSDVPWKDRFHNDEYRHLAPVGSYPKGATPEGVCDLGGNVKEWTATAGWEKGTAITKGGSFENAFDDMQGADQRPCNLDAIHATLGFRCAEDK